MHQGSNFSTSLPTLIFSLFCFIIAILVRIKWRLIVFSICISLMMSDNEHVFTCVLAICISSLEKCLFEYFADFWFRLFVLLLWSSRSSLYNIRDINPLSDIWHYLFSPLYPLAQSERQTRSLLSFTSGQVTSISSWGRFALKEKKKKNLCKMLLEQEKDPNPFFSLYLPGQVGKNQLHYLQTTG